MSRRDPHRGGESSRRVRFEPSKSDLDVIYPGKGSYRTRVAESRRASGDSYTTSSSFASQPSGRTVNDILLCSRGYSDDELVESLSPPQHDDQTDVSGCESTRGTELSVLQERETLLLDSGRQPNTSHWESRTLDLEYGEEPTSVLDDVTRAEHEEVFERQKLPETAARERRMPQDLSDEELDQYLACLNQVHEPSRIRDGLFIANYETACYYLDGKGNKDKHFPKIGYILSLINFHPKEAHLYEPLTSESKDFPEGTRLLLDLKDSIQVNLMECFPLIISFIVHAINQGGKPRGNGKGILVHCRKGMSRSVAAVMAYLTWAENKSIIEVWQDTVARRIVAWPNPEFYTQLCMWRMWDCKLTDENGDEKSQYSEYVLEKGLRSAVEGVKADLTAHLRVKPPAKWPVGIAKR